MWQILSNVLNSSPKATTKFVYGGLALLYCPLRDSSDYIVKITMSLHLSLSALGSERK